MPSSGTCARGRTRPARGRPPATSERSGCRWTACFMVGNPGETEEDIRSSIRFAKELRAESRSGRVQHALSGQPPIRRAQGRAGQTGDPSRRRPLRGRSVVSVRSRRPRPCQRLQRRFYLEYFLHPPQLLQLARQRSLFALFDPRERALVASTLRYLLPRTAKAGADPRREVDRGHAAPARAPVARHKVCLTREELGLVARFMGGRRSLPGARGAFEQAAAAYLGTRQVFALESGRAALAFGLRALGLPPGAVIVLPNYSFYSSVVVVEALGFRGPVRAHRSRDHGPRSGGPRGVYRRRQLRHRQRAVRSGGHRWKPSTTSAAAPVCRGSKTRPSRPGRASGDERSAPSVPSASSVSSSARTCKPSAAGWRRARTRPFCGA